jgi:glycosyltransferase involved in cell wall biosynthesis
VAAGIPVVASAIGGVPDYVVHGKNGLICKPDNADDLAAKIREACNHPLFSKGQVDAETLAAKREHLSAARAARMFVDAYHRVYGERKPSQSIAS